MIEIGPNLKEVLISIIAVSPVIGFFLFIYLTDRLENPATNKNLQHKKNFFSMDNPLIYLIISLVLALILVYIFRIK